MLASFRDQELVTLPLAVWIRAGGCSRLAPQQIARLTCRRACVAAVDSISWAIVTTQRGSTLSVDKDFVLRALLQHNFFPTQKKAKEEMPPIFTSVAFTPDLAKKLVAGKPRKVDGYQGYDAVEYKLTRFNGVSRSCAIPHPTAYAQLSLCIHEHWDKLDYIGKNKISGIRPIEHSDGRIIIMDYEKSFEKTKRKLRGAFGRRFTVHTDISNCFPSVYSHAIPWATVGFDYAKKHKSTKYKTEWFNQLDEKVRWLKRGETQGIAIGPATSNILSEVILARVDETLRGKFVYTRFIDDYTAYCETEEKAQEFVRQLSEELAKYKLLLNIRKTEVIPLPHALAADWVAELSLALPRTAEVSARDAINYLNLAVRLAQQTPDGSVLKYALKSLVSRKLGFMADVDILQYGLTLSFHHPVLLPLLEKLFDSTMFAGKFLYARELQQLALEHARLRRSDAVAWTLYYLNKYGVSVEAACADEILASRDCVSLLLLYLSGDPLHQTRVLSFVGRLDLVDLYELDQYWLLLYELFRAGKIASRYKDEDAFEIMAANAVGFIMPTELAASE